MAMDRVDIEHLAEKVVDYIYHGSDEWAAPLIAEHGLCATELCRRNFTFCQRAIYGSPKLMDAYQFASGSTWQRIRETGITDPSEAAREYYDRPAHVFRFRLEDLPSECRVEKDPAWEGAVRIKGCACTPPEILETCEMPTRWPWPGGVYPSAEEAEKLCEGRWKRVKEEGRGTRRAGD